MLSAMMGATAIAHRAGKRNLLDQYSAGSVNTFGWDTVFAIELPQVNEQIRLQKSSPAAFEQGVSGAKGWCTFDDWRIAPTGDGTLLHMEIGLKDIGISTRDKDKQLPDAVVAVEVQLEFVPKNPEIVVEQTDVVPHDLVVKTEAETQILEDGDIIDDPVAHITRIRFADGKNRYGDSAIIQACLNKWLNQNLQQFVHVFATVNLARKVADGAFDWVKPTYTSYAFLGGDTEEECVLAVLCMSNKRSALHLYETLAPSALPSLTTANFIVSGERMLDEMIRKNLPKAFKGLKVKDAVLAEDKRSLEVTKTVNLTNVKHDGETYKAKLLYLKVWLDGDQVCVDSRTETEVSPGIYSECRATNRYRIKLINATAGGQTISFEDVGEPIVNHTTRHSKAIDILKWIIIAIGVIVTAIVGVVTLGSGFLIAGLCVALVAGTFAAISQIPNIIEAVKRGDAPPIDLLMDSVTSSFKWAGVGLFKLKDAIFSDSLVLSGDFVTA